MLTKDQILMNKQEFIGLVRSINREGADIERLIKWKQQWWKTMLFLLMSTFVLLYSKMCFVFVVPLVLLVMLVY